MVAMVTTRNHLTTSILHIVGENFNCMNSDYDVYLNDALCNRETKSTKNNKLITLTVSFG